MTTKEMRPVVKSVSEKMEKLPWRFTQKPLLVGGKAMEYYGLREAGADIDLIICNEDYLSLARQFPEERKDLYGDLGVVLWPFEIWRSIALLDYTFYKVGAKEYDTICVVSFERLLFMRVIAREAEKYNNDLDLMVESVYSKCRNQEYLDDANKHIQSYRKHNGTIFSGAYDD